MWIAGQKEMQMLDAYTMNELGLPGIVLMENAGAAVVNEIMKDFPERQTKITVLAGRGNNGGDGFVIARRLSDYGYNATLCLLAPEERLKGDAKLHFDVYKKRQLPLIQLGDEQIFNSVQDADVIVDALLGTGIQGEVREPIAEVIKLINDSNKTVYAVDIPSGVNSDTGEVTKLAVKATKTITFVLPKKGFFLGDGPEYIGEWLVADISVPPAIVQHLELKLPKLLDEATALSALPRRKKSGHKGTFGHSLVIGGSRAYIGAPLYTAKAAFQTGSGLVTLAIPESLFPIFAVRAPECLFSPIADKDGTLTRDGLYRLDFSTYTSIAFGPGLGRDCDGSALWQSLLEKATTQPIVIDADGLFFIKQNLHSLKAYEGALILTPHPGEMATILGTTVAEIEGNRLEVAEGFASEYGVYLLLKGHRPIIATPNGEVWLNPFGNDALGKGGSGDVLTGFITSILSQGAAPLQAMQAATYFHGQAGEALGKEISQYGVTPTDVIEYVRRRLIAE